MVDALERKDHRMDQRVSQYRKEARKSRQEVKRLRTKLNEQRAANTLLQRDLEAQSRLLRVRGAELREAQAYAATVDTVSHQDVLRVLDALNAEIFQFAAEVADSVEVVNAAPPEDDTLRMLQQAMGHGMVEMLTAVAQGRCDSVGVQIALQAVLVQCVYMAASSWAASPEQNVAFQAVYDNIFATGTSSYHRIDTPAHRRPEPPSIAAKWKALTRRYGTHLHVRHDVLQRTLLDTTSDVLQLAGGRLDVVPAPVIQGFAIRIDEIVKLTMKLRSHIGEDAASSDLRIIPPSPGGVFDATLMDDANALPGKASVGVVLCTTELGLLRREKTGSVGEDAGNVSTTVVKKASIVLEGIVGELVNS